MSLKDQLAGWCPKRKVLYKGREVSVKSVLLSLYEENVRLKRNQCRPNSSCLSKYDDYMDKFVYKLNFKLEDILENRKD